MYGGASLCVSVYWCKGSNDATPGTPARQQTLTTESGALEGHATSSEGHPSASNGHAAPTVPCDTREESGTPRSKLGSYDLSPSRTPERADTCSDSREANSPASLTAFFSSSATEVHSATFLTTAGHVFLLHKK